MMIIRFTLQFISITLMAFIDFGYHIITDNSHYLDMAKLETQKPNFIGLEANLKNRERRSNAL